jgi:hypothetical protein
MHCVAAKLVDLVPTRLGNPIELAVEAVISEPVSGALSFPVRRELTAKFGNLEPQNGVPPLASDGNSIAYQQNSLRDETGKMSRANRDASSLSRVTDTFPRMASFGDTDNRNGVRFVPEAAISRIVCGPHSSWLRWKFQRGQGIAITTRRIRDALVNLCRVRSWPALDTLLA